MCYIAKGLNLPDIYKEPSHIPSRLLHDKDKLKSAIEDAETNPAQQDEETVGCNLVMATEQMRVGCFPTPA